MIRRIRHRLLHRSDRGMSLPELIVAMGLLTVLLTVVVSFYATFSRSFAREENQNVSTDTASLAMQNVTKLLRSATPVPASASLTRPAFVQVSASSITFYALIGSDSRGVVASKVKLELTGGRLVETRWQGTLVNGYTTFPTAATSTRTLVNDAVDPASLKSQSRFASESFPGRLFSFLDPSGAAITSLPTTTCDPATAAALSSAACVFMKESIASVQVVLAVQSAAGTSALPAVIQNSVGLPSLDIPRTETVS